MRGGGADAVRFIVQKGRWAEAGNLVGCTDELRRIPSQEKRTAVNILITSVGRRNYIVDAFREALNGEGIVVGVNSIQNCSGMYASDVRYVVPPVLSKDYIPRVIEICRDHRIRMILSLMDQDSLVLSAHRRAFLDMGILPAVSHEKTLELAFDKYQIREFLESRGFAYPATFRSVDETEADLENGKLTFPLILKPRWGSGSVCTEVANTPEELRFFFAYLTKKVATTPWAEHANTGGKNEILIQRFIDGDEYNLDSLNDFEGSYVTTFVRKKLAMRAGETDIAMTVADDTLKVVGAQMSTALGQIGIMDLDVMCGKDGRTYVLDANPRFGGGYPFSHAGGANVPACYVSWLKGERPRKEWLEATPNITAAKGIELYRKQ
jgi:carbamoyl-phosphate synthase large subunit